jgi:ubiquinone biosynthesis protein
MRGVLRTIRHFAAFIRVAILLVRYDAVFPLRVVPGGAAVAAILRLVIWRRSEVIGLRPGERLALAFQNLGPSFIKLGQALSTRSDLLGETMAADLSRLQDQLPAFPTAAAIATIEGQLGRTMGDLFRSFEPEPVAAASVAQVHFAITTDGREVAVKVLRPGVEAVFDSNISLLLWIAEMAEWWEPSTRRLKPVGMVLELRDAVAFEMDLRLEAAAASELARNFSGDPDFRVPAVDWNRTGQRVLTTERIRGITVDEREALIAAGHDPREIVRKAATAFFAMVFRDGLFHADLHPGNLFVAPDGAVVAVDFGIMGRLDRAHRYYLADMLHGFLTGDYRKVAEVHFDAGFVPRTQSIEAFAQACRSIGEPLLGRPLEEISIGHLLSQLFEITRKFEMEAQPQLMMLQKTMVLAEGLGRSLDPGVNMWVLTRPLVADWMAVHRSPPARLAIAAAEAGRRLERLPALLSDLEKAVGELATGGLKLHPDTVRAMTGQRPGGLLGVALPLWIAALALIAFVVMHS